MSLLRLAQSESKVIPLADDGSFIEVLADINKRTFNELALSMPTDLDAQGGSLTIQQAIEFQRALFRVFVTGWSLDVPATVDNYDLLNREAADAVDLAISKHFESLTPSDQEASKSAGPSAVGGRRERRS